MFLQTNDVTHRSLYTEQLLHADILAQRGLCTKKKCTQTPLHTEVFTHRYFVQRCFCAYKQRHIRVFTHRTFSTEKPLHRTIFTYCFYTKNIFDTEKFERKDCTQIFLTLPRAIFTQQISFRTEVFYALQFLQTGFFSHRRFSAQKSYAQKVLRTTKFTYRHFYTQMSLYRHKLHTAMCTSTRLRTSNLYTERLCFPFLPS